MTGHWIVVVLVGCLTGLLLGLLGFNRPTWSRSFTTAGRYGVAVSVHSGIYALLLFILYAAVRRGMRDSVANWEGDAAKDTALELAVLLTIALRLFMPFARRLRDAMHRMCGITDQANRFAKFLAESKIEASADVRAKALAMLSNRSIGTEETWIAPAKPVYACLLRTTTLFLQLRDWEDGVDVRRFSGFVKEASNEFDQLRRRFDRLIVRAARARSSIDRVGTVKLLHSQHTAGSGVAEKDVEQFDEHLRRLVTDGVADICEDITVFHRDACLLAARGVMVVAPTRASRDRCIVGLGFTPSVNRTPSAYATLGYAAVLLYVGACLFFLILPRQTHAIAQAVVNVVITVNVLGSLAIAILPKSRWGFATTGLHQKTPLPFLFAASVCSVLFAVGVNLAAGAAVLGGWAGAMQRLTEAAAYLPSQFFTTATIVWLTQDHRWADLSSSRMRRLRDALTLAAVWVAATAVSQLFLPAASRSSPIGQLIGACIFGAVIGFVVPGSVRREPLRPESTGFDLPLSDFELGRAPVDPALRTARSRPQMRPAEHQVIG